MKIFFLLFVFLEILIVKIFYFGKFFGEFFFFNFFFVIVLL